jgi:RNA polymerase sigma-70 factor (ECF subfamily)
MVYDFQPILFSVAYNMLGDRAEAEDVVHDVFLKWHQANQSHVENVKSYLVKSTVNSALNYLHSAHKKRLTYPNIWLPEPMPDTDVASGYSADQRTILTYELMVALKELKPLEVAVFVLKEAFDYTHDEIAEMLGTTVEHSRQLLKRAKAKVRNRSAAAHRPSKEDRRLAEEIVEAIGRADAERLLKILTKDTRIMADGGGIVGSSPKPIVGAEKVVHLLLTSSRKLGFKPRVRFHAINGQAGWVVYDGTRPVAAFILTRKRSKIVRIYAILNPAKLSSFARPLQLQP